MTDLSKPESFAEWIKRQPELQDVNVTSLSGSELERAAATFVGDAQPGSPRFMKAAHNFMSWLLGGSKPAQPPTDTPQNIIHLDPISALLERRKGWGLGAIQIDVTDLEARLENEGAEAVMADYMRQAREIDEVTGRTTEAQHDDVVFMANVRVKADATDAAAWRGKPGMLVGSAGDYYEVDFGDGIARGIKKAETEPFFPDDIPF